MMSFHLLLYQNSEETLLLVRPRAKAEHCSLIFLHLENGMKENITWEEKNSEKQPTREAPPPLAGKQKIPEVLEALWHRNS